MKKMISLIVALVVCLSFCCSVYAEEFVDSPNQNPTTSQCTHENCELINAKDASCSAEGYTGDLVCSDCGVVIEEGEAIAKIEHTYNAEGICTVCGGAKTEAPITGDSAMIGLWIGMMLFSVVGLVAVVVVYRKKFANC